MPFFVVAEMQDLLLRTKSVPFFAPLIFALFSNIGEHNASYLVRARE